MSDMKKLKGKRIAILATEGFEESELFSPKEALENAGALVEIVSLQVGTIRSWKDSEWSYPIKVDKLASEVGVQDYDGLMLPGGALNADQLRGNHAAVNFVKSFVDAGKPISAICHAAWNLIEAGGVDGIKMTSWGSLKTDLENAGAIWMDKQVVVDGNLVTSRNPDDLPFFNEKMIEVMGQTSSKKSSPAKKPDSLASEMVN